MQENNSYLPLQKELQLVIWFPVAQEFYFLQPIKPVSTLPSPAPGP